MFEESPNSRRLWDFWNRKFGQVVSVVAMMKTLSVMSQKLPRYYRIHLNCIAPSRSFKSQTSGEVMSLFKSQVIDLHSDFTINSLEKQFKNTKKLDRSWFINDATLLFSSKAPRTRSRLINAFSEIMSEGIYKYGDFSKEFSIEANCTIIMNMTTKSFNQYETEELGNTFLERTLTIFYSVTEEEERDFTRHINERVAMKPPRIEPLKDIGKRAKILLAEISIPKHEDRIAKLAETYSAESLMPYMDCHNRLAGIVLSSAILNNRNQVNNDDFKLIDLLIKGKF